LKIKKNASYPKYNPKPIRDRSAPTEMNCNARAFINFLKLVAILAIMISHRKIPRNIPPL
jgi:hypothetical protein